MKSVKFLIMALCLVSCLGLTSAEAAQTMPFGESDVERETLDVDCSEKFSDEDKDKIADLKKEITVLEEKHKGDFATLDEEYMKIAENIKDDEEIDSDVFAELDKKYMDLHEKSGIIKLRNEMGEIMDKYSCYVDEINPDAVPYNESYASDIALVGHTEEVLENGDLKSEQEDSIEKEKPGFFKRIWNFFFG